MVLLSSSGGFNWYGFLIALGIGAGIAIAYFVARYRGHNPEVVFDICIWAVPFAIIGARLYFIIFEAINPASTVFSWDEGFWHVFMQMIGFSDGTPNFKDGNFELRGLAIYGGVIGGVLGAFCNSRVYKKKGRKENFAHMLDIGAPFLLLGQAIGRWGNFANQELYGQEILNPFFQHFPFAVEVGGKYFQALFLYESVLNIIGFGLLLWFLIGKRRSAPGFVISCYAIWYGVVRFVLEGMRPSEFVLYLIPDVLPVSQFVSIIIILLGLIYILRKIYTAKTNGEKIPFFKTRGQWEEAGWDMFDWGRIPGTPFPVKAKGGASKAFSQDGEEAEDGAVPVSHVHKQKILLTNTPLRSRPDLLAGSTQEKGEKNVKPAASEQTENIEKVTAAVGAENIGKDPSQRVFAGKPKKPSDKK